MNWKLIEVGKTKWIQDGSGYYTLIHYIKDGVVRIDFMRKDDMPVISFRGNAGDVRKYIMQNLPILLQPEHCSYIGAELTRCALQGTEYIQD